MIIENETYWTLIEGDAVYWYKFPLSESHVKREQWRIRTLYTGIAGTWIENIEAFKLWSKFIAAIACPLDM